ncbi:hypothetical protein [Jatrophihabitans sp.]|uniref:hypothetical protein n=1 Tax=Jatrophihabitans sp. TaxID=1932789 RepID=UPI0030C67206|nr:hypothetical protein [Jatrophihabitans sp.]
MTVSSRLRRVVAFVSAFLAVFLGATLTRSTAQTSADSGSVTKSVVVDRSEVDADGDLDYLDKPHRVTVTVDTTKDVRGRQELGVSWTGAHPTGGLVADVNSGDASQEEYPFVLLECRGTAATITPETCWTQTSQERFQEDGDQAFPPYRIDSYASAADRDAFVNQPDPIPSGCPTDYLAAHWVPFTAADKKVYLGGSGGCAGVAPEATDVGGAGLPSNTTYGITASDGSGAANFDVFTADENASLGCSDTVACSVVAVPIEGVSCDAYGGTDVLGLPLPPEDQVPIDDAPAAAAECAATGAYTPGEQFQAGIRSDISVTGALWWSASNWHNRMTIPLSFATPSSVCSVVSSGPSEDIYGSVIFAEASAQWEPKFCTDKKLFNFTHVQTSDPAARNLLAAGDINAALSSEGQPGGYGRPVVQAPLAVSGFAISYDIDDAEHNAYTSLRLTPRLLAKLLTQSYPADPEVKNNYTPLKNNPINITWDPEFRALNPGIPELSTEAAAEMINISSQADLTYALTSYINADPEARAWLNGKPDPWGMVVNPRYKDIALPVSAWPLLDTYLLPKSYIKSDVNACYTNSPSPWLSLIANPTALLANIAQDMQFSLSNVEIDCPTGDLSDPSTLKMQTQGRQATGSRFLIGITSLGEVSRYGLTAAALQTTANVADPSAQFTDAEGRSFVAPSAQSLRSAADLLKPDNSAGVWDFPYDALHKGGSADQAYPGTMVIYADVPTSALPKADAAKLATFLRFAAGPGQVAGLENGELPPGYLPITKANGLEALATYTSRAADAVAAQAGAVPRVDGSTLPSSPPATPTAPATTSSTAGEAASVPPLAVGSVTVPTASPTSTAAPSEPASAEQTGPAASPESAALRTPTARSPVALVVLPILFALTFLAALLAPAFRYPHLLRRPGMLLRTLLPRGTRP